MSNHGKSCVQETISIVFNIIKEIRSNIQFITSLETNSFSLYLWIPLREDSSLLHPIEVQDHYQVLYIFCEMKVFKTVIRPELNSKVARYRTPCKAKNSFAKKMTLHIFWCRFNYNPFNVTLELPIESSLLIILSLNYIKNLSIYRALNNNQFSYAMYDSKHLQVQQFVNLIAEELNTLDILQSAHAWSMSFHITIYYQCFYTDRIVATWGGCKTVIWLKH